MKVRKPRSTRTDTLLPYTTPFRSSRAGQRGRSETIGCGRPAGATFLRRMAGRRPADRQRRRGRRRLAPLRRSPHSAEVKMGSGSSTAAPPSASRSEEHTSELQSLMRISYAVFCLKKKTKKIIKTTKQELRHHNNSTQHSH